MWTRSGKIFSAQGLPWQAVLKKTKVKLDLLTDIYMVLIVENSIREVICHTIHRDENSNNKYMKDYGKNK